MDRTRLNRGFALGIALCLVVAACGAPTTPSTGPGGSAAAIGSLAPIVSPAGGSPSITIPAPPAAADMPTGSIDDQAAALAKAVAPGGQAALAPLIAAYQAAGIPIIGGDGHPVAGSAADQVGPGWWQVWLSAGSNPQFTIALTDATKLLVAIPNAPTVDTAALATAALADLRTMAADTDPHRRFFARFVADLSTNRSGVDALDPATTTDDLKLTPVAVEFFMAGLLRSIEIAAVKANPAAVLSPRRQIASIGQPLPPGQQRLTDGGPAANPCNPTGDADAVSYWSQWIASKLAGGLNLPGMNDAMQSVVQLVVKNASLGAKLAQAAAVLGGAIGALTFLLEMATLDVSIKTDPSPLVRTHSGTQPGNQSVLTATLKYDLEKSSLDGGAGIKNCLLIMANALGIQAALPADGAVAGARLKFLGTEGFNQGTIDTGGFVLFTNGASQVTQDTDPGGLAKIDIEGRRQKKDIPDSAPPVDRTASVQISAQPEAENARSLASTFWDSFVALGSGPVGAVAPIIDVLKGTMFDLGNYQFKVQDWQLGWTMTTGLLGGTLTGTKCDALDGDWVINGGKNQGALVQTIHFTVTFHENSKKGIYEYSNNNVVSAGAGTVVSTINGVGKASITIAKDGTVTMVLDATTGTATAVTGGQKVTEKVSIPGVQFTWAPKECDQPPA
jgi:hypothetical protein